MLSREHWHWCLSPSLFLLFSLSLALCYWHLLLNISFPQTQRARERPMHPRLKSEHEKACLAAEGPRTFYYLGRGMTSVSMDETKGLLIIHSSWRAFTFPTSAKLFLHRRRAGEMHTYTSRVHAYLWDISRTNWTPWHLITSNVHLPRDLRSLLQRRRFNPFPPPPRWKFRLKIPVANLQLKLTSRASCI